jgi:hypothetical protein
MSGRANLSDFGKDLGVEKLLELVRVAETAERYDDMCQFVKALVEEKSKKGQDLDVEERNLLSVAYKNVVGSKRASWRTLSGGFDDIDEALIDKYKKIIEKELNEICMEVINLLNNHLIKNVENKNDETEIFYLKMCGDYYRYLAEMNLDSDFKIKAKEYYTKAMDKATNHLAETHPTRLGLALNFSVCYYEILKEPEKACELAKKSFDAAIEKLDTLNDASYKDSTLIMQLLRDNLTLWTSEQQQDEADD